MHLIQIIHNYLSNRSTQLTYGRGHAHTNLTLSTPQGAVLSPFLWNLFIDDLLVLLHSHGIKSQAFVDDCTILLEYDRKDISGLQKEIKRITILVHDWGINNKASFNNKPK